MALRIQIVRSETPDAPRRRRRWTVLAATVVATLLVTGVSYAFWTATGTGFGTVSSPTAGALTAVGTSVGQLFPTRTPANPGDTQTMNLTLSNPNPYPVIVNSATLTSYKSDVESGAAACPAASNLNVLPGPFAVGVTVPAKGTAPYTISNFVYMLWTASDNCQTKTFTFNFTLTGNQA